MNIAMNMKHLLAFAAAVIGAATVTTAAPRAWTAIVAPSPTGSYAVGNPKARVQLIEYVSYTCPHCAHFTAEAAPTLDAMVKSGSLRIEYRNQVHDKSDLIAATLVRCAGPAAFRALHAALFAKQSEWTQRAWDWDQANAQRIAPWPEAAQLRALVDGAGLADIARGAGMKTAAIDACFADKAAMGRTIAATKYTEKVDGTPAFEINGRLADTSVWDKLQPKLRAAGAR